MKKSLLQPSSFSICGMIANTKKIALKAFVIFFNVLIGVDYASAQEIQESALQQIQSLMDEEEPRIAGEKENFPHREHFLAEH